jgi:hypothetical protein
MNRMKVALIAHDGKKASMVSFVMKRLEFFNKENVEIVTTGTTGTMILHAGVDKVERVHLVLGVVMLKLGQWWFVKKSMQLSSLETRWINTHTMWIFPC